MAEKRDLYQGKPEFIEQGDDGTKIMHASASEVLGRPDEIMVVGQGDPRAAIIEKVLGVEEPTSAEQAASFLAKGGFLAYVQQAPTARFSDFLQIMQKWPAGSLRNKAGKDVTNDVLGWLEYLSNNRANGNPDLDMLTEAGGFRAAISLIYQREDRERQEQAKIQEAIKSRKREAEDAQKNLELVVTNFKKQGVFDVVKEPKKLTQFIAALLKEVTAYNQAIQAGTPRLNMPAGESVKYDEKDQISFVVKHEIETPGRLWGTNRHKVDTPLTIKLFTMPPYKRLLLRFETGGKSLTELGLANLENVFSKQSY